MASEGDGHSSEPRPQNRPVYAIWPYLVPWSPEGTRPVLRRLTVAWALESDEPGIESWLGHLLTGHVSLLGCLPSSSLSPYL